MSVSSNFGCAGVRSGRAWGVKAVCCGCHMREIVCVMGAVAAAAAGITSHEYIRVITSSCAFVRRFARALCLLMALKRVL